MTSQLITNIANIALTLSVIVAVIFGIAQVRAAARSRHDQLTLEILRQFQTKEFVALLHYINTAELPKNWTEMQQLPANEQMMLIQFGQQMESVGMMVAEGLINVELVDKTLGSFVILAWEKSKPMIIDIRENQPDPFLGEYYQWLAESIAERMEKCPRQPFHERGR
ncbi:MAG: DUF4760 domain-containing protein [Mucilaginibacter sp.]